MDLSQKPKVAYIFFYLPDFPIEVPHPQLGEELGKLGIITSCEDEFGIEFSGEELGTDDKLEFNIIGDLIAAVERKIAEKLPRAPLPR